MLRARYWVFLAGDLDGWSHAPQSRVASAPCGRYRRPAGTPSRGRRSRTGSPPRGPCAASLERTGGLAVERAGETPCRCEGSRSPGLPQRAALQAPCSPRECTASLALEPPAGTAAFRFRAPG
ncbi:PP18 [Orf virus]|uniref:PP18 n=1 Tax=Orf virus TaxID=10258 RepID=F1AXF9_ORFV|nr:PP18 [Orf virus]